MIKTILKIGGGGENVRAEMLEREQREDPSDMQVPTLEKGGISVRIWGKSTAGRGAASAKARPWVGGVCVAAPG